jgi:tetratricopeptide (TPR) repeat protein
MEILLPVLFILFIVGFIIYAVIRFSSQEATTKTLLGEYAAFGRAGLSESERLFKLLATRGGWKVLPSNFLRELSSRLGNKENLIQFVILSERHRFDQTHFPRFAMDTDDIVEGEELAMSYVGSLFASTGNSLFSKKNFAEAERYYLLATYIYPNHSTYLPLATVYYSTGRYREALPIFRREMNRFREAMRMSEQFIQFLPSAADLGSYEEMTKLEKVYSIIYQDCLEKIGEGNIGQEINEERAASVKTSNSQLPKKSNEQCDQVPGAFGRFGFDESNPIPADGNWYCQRLRCPNGHPYWYHRPGSVGFGPDGHMVDSLELQCFGGESRINLFFDMYHKGASSLVPEGLILGLAEGIGTTKGIIPNFPKGLM